MYEIETKGFIVQPRESDSIELSVNIDYLLTLLQLPLIEVGNAVRAYCYSISFLSLRHFCSVLDT